MGEIRVTISDDMHKKLNILCMLYNKKQAEMLEYLIRKARVPGQIDFLIADENPKIVQGKEIQEKIKDSDILIAD